MRHSFVFLASLAIMSAATLAASNRDDQVLERAHRLQLEFRHGNLDAAKPLVAELEAAVAVSRDNASLWEAMGNAYMSLQGSMLAAGPDMPVMIATVERARDAYDRSLALDPNRPLVRASRGMSQMVSSLLQGDGAGIAAGVEEMNTAVRQAPNSTGVRLTRAFTTIHLPPAMRDTDAVIEDLKFILDTAPGGRPQDVLHVMLGDVYTEMGKPGPAREEYAKVSGSSAFAADQVKRRFASLAKGAVEPADIAQVRAGTGTRCVMCHAPGSDN